MSSSMLGVPSMRYDIAIVVCDMRWIRAEKASLISFRFSHGEGSDWSFLCLLAVSSIVSHW